jgi:DNA-binding response OmpR family regulator
VRVLIVEDNQSLASLVATRLQQAGIDSDVAGSAAQARRALATLDYAAIVLDLGLPDGDGLELLRSLRRSGNATPVLAATARHGLEDRVLGLREGADDYLPKPFSVEELVARLHAILRRPGRLVGQVLRAGNVALNPQLHQLNIDDRIVPSRLRETVILELLMRHLGSVVKRSHLEDELFGLEGESDSNTVDVYIHRIRRQLAESNATVAIHTIRGIGYMLMETARPGPEKAREIRT